MRETGPDCKKSAREAFMDAGERLMGRQGYHATSVTALCKSSGYPTGSLYHHFGSKAGLLAAILERGTDRMRQALRDVDVPEGSAAEWLEAHFDTILSLIERHPDFTRLTVLVLLEEGFDPEVERSVVSFREQMIDNMFGVMDKALNEHGAGVPETVTRELSDMAAALLMGTLALSVADMRRLVTRFLRLLVASTEQLAPR
ncbi:TetR/AcrR family transcriptional regulator [Streptomyces sp. NPDC091215]|uniref:TetR/AcrR family transcriptional regulator n=1 Tax=Streptomyces sp. NPDC091215 TaxID=3155192 RepID=UPI003435DB0E